MTPKEQAEQAARAFLEEWRDTWAYEEAMDKLVTFLLTQRAAVLEEVAGRILYYNCEHNHGKKATKACDDLEDLFRQQAKEARG